VEEPFKRVVWMGDSLAQVREFSAPARQDAGYQLDRVQRGLDPRDWRPMKSVGPGAAEIRVHAGGEFRVVYLAKFRDAVYVLHAFSKKTQKTPLRDVVLARERYRILLQQEGRK